VGQQKNRSNHYTNVKDKEEYGHGRPGLPPSSAKRKEPEKDRPQSALDSVGNVLGVGNPIHLPTEPPDIPDHTYYQANEEDEK
jgi:hypothetical protein